MDENMASSLSTEQIIEEVKKCPILYDLANPKYKHIRKKNKIWDEIGKSLNAEGEDVKKRWKNLRDAYAKHIRSEMSHTGQNTKSVDRYKSWPWAKQMSFLKPFLHFSYTESSVAETDPQSPESLSSTEETVEEQCFQPLLQRSKKSSSTNYKTPCKTSSTKKRCCEDADAHFTTAEEVLDYLQSRNASSHETDEIDLLFMGYAKTVKKFSSRRKTMIKYQFAKIIMEAELEQQMEDETGTCQTRYSISINNN